jgi:hypothetical protein
MVVVASGRGPRDFWGSLYADLVDIKISLARNGSTLGTFRILKIPLVAHDLPEYIVLAKHEHCQHFTGELLSELHVGSWEMRRLEKYFVSSSTGHHIYPTEKRTLTYRGIYVAFL